MQFIAVIQEKPVINKILESVGDLTKPPTLTPARGPPSWNDYNQDLSADDEQIMSSINAFPDEPSKHIHFLTMLQQSKFASRILLGLIVGGIQLKTDDFLEQGNYS